MTTSRRLAPLPLLIIGLAALAVLVLIPWDVHAQTPANQSATGRPLILASAEGAPILFADTSYIADGNGLPYTPPEGAGAVIEFTYSYQWIRVDGGTETNVGVDSPSYYLVDADTGKVIKVEVSFTDDDSYSEAVTSLPFGPITEPADSSVAPSTLVSNTGQSNSATAAITQQYAMEFTLGDHGQGYEISSVSIELAAAPSNLTVSLWIGNHSGRSSSVPQAKLFDFENPSAFAVGLNKFTAPPGVIAYPSVRYYIVLTGFGSTLSIKQTTSDNEDAGGETGAELRNNAQVRASSATGPWTGTVSERASVLRLAVEGSRRDSGILVSTYAQPVEGDQEIISVGDDCCFEMGAGNADRYLIRGFSWNSDDTTPASGGITLPWNLRDGTGSSATKLFRLINTRNARGITEFSAPQGATVPGGSSKTYTFELDFAFLNHIHDGTRTGGVLTRIFGTKTGNTGIDTPTAPGVTISTHGDIAVAQPIAAVLGVPLDAMVQNLGQTDKNYRTVGSGTVKVLSQGFATGSNASGYELQGIGVNIEGSGSNFPDGPTSVSVAVHADSSGEPGAKLFDLISPTEYAAGHSFFEAPRGAALEGSTSYVMVWSHLGGTVHRMRKTGSNSEDSGALTGFSIANAFYQGADLDNLAVDTGSDALEIVVYGGLATIPAVTAVALTSDPGTDETYAIDDAVDATVTFSEAVDITGAPQLELDFAGAPKTADCATATNTTTMVCSYTVAENDLAENGIAIAANKLTLNGGAITLTGAARAAVLTHSAVTIDSGHKVDGVRPTLVTTGNDAPQTSVDGTQVILTFNEDISSISIDSIVLRQGLTPISAGTTATFSGRTVTVTLHPVFTIQHGQTVTLGLNFGAVRDPAGNSIDLVLLGQAVTNNVPEPPAVITAVAITSDPGMDEIYATGDVIEVTATFDQAVTVTGTPRIEIWLGDVGRTGRWAEYASGSGSTAIVFAYTVVATDESDTDGLAVGFNPFTTETVDLNDGTITVADTGADASVAYTPVSSDSGHRVNWARPTLSGAVTSRDGTEVLLTFSENLVPGGFSLTLFTVKVDGTAVTLSGTVATVSGRVVSLPLATALTSVTQTVTVSYADPTTGDDDANIQDVAKNDADSFTDQTVTNTFGTISTTPAVTAVALTSTPNNNTYGIGDEIEATVTFSEAVDITGAPQLELDFAGTPKTADCAADTNTTTMVCDYEVVVNDSAPNGITIAANKLTLNGGTITATGSTTITADLDHAAVAIDAGQKVDGIRPALVTSGSDAPRTSTDGTKVILTFTEAISSVVRTNITIFSSGGVVPTSNDSISGRTVEITLTTVLTASATSLRVNLAVEAVTDAVGNANAALVGTTVTNAVVTATGRPGKPSVTVESRNQALAVTWTIPNDGGNPTTEYEVQWKSGSQTYDASRRQTGLTSANARIENLTNHTLYTVQVRAMNAHGWSDWSNEKTGTPMEEETPEGPAVSIRTTTLFIDEGGSDTYTVVLTIGPTSAVTILISAEGDVTTQPNILHFTPSNWDTRQTVMVSASNDDDATDDTVTITHTVTSGSASEYAALTNLASVQVTVRDDDRPPPPVRGLLAADESQDAIAMNWWSERGAAEYQIEYRKQGDSGAWTRVTRGDFDHLPSTSGNRSLTSIATGLECNTTYDFRIRMRGSGDILVGVFGPHTEISHKTGQCAEADKATNLMYTLTPACATLTWTAPTMGDYTGVRIRRQTLGEYKYIVIHESLNSRPTSYRDCTHTGDGYGDGDSPHYSYMVTYIKSDGAGGIEESKRAYSGFRDYGPAFQDHLHAMPRNVRLTRDTDSQRLMTWEAPPSWSLTIWAGLQGANVPVRDPWITGYVVERREFRVRADNYSYFLENEDWEVLREGNGGDTTTFFSDNEQANGRKFVYRIMTTNALGTSRRSMFDWLWDSPHRDAVIALAATDTTDDGGAGNGETSTGNAGDGRTNNAATGAPTIDGTAQVGETLTTSTSGITDADGLDDATYRYQWTAGGSDIDGATGSTYLLTNSDVGKTIQVQVTFTDDSGNEESLTSAATGEVEARPNTPATGAPTISGTPQVGETLTADTSAIEDTDGLTRVSYNYQWFAAGYAVEGATSSTYLLTPSDKGQTITVRVTFSDDADNTESLTSAATDEVAASPTPLTASFLAAPSSHDGDNSFTFELRFSEEFELSYVTLRDDDTFSVTNGEVTGASRLDQPSNLRWQIVVEPDADADVTIVLPPTTDCGAQGAICTGDGKKLSGQVELTVNGPEQQNQERQNNPPTGLPTISGTPQVEQTLTADTSAIDDTDGLTSVSYDYQWLAAGSAIDGATGPTHTLTASEEGQTIQVQVTFTDDAGNSETLTSVATDAVAAKPIPLTASFSNVPDSHDGSTWFTFDLSFSENVKAGYERIRDDAFTVSGGDVTQASRTQQGSNQGWTIRVQPFGNGAVSITLPETTGCDVTGAICTYDQRVLSHSTSVSIVGPE